MATTNYNAGLSGVVGGDDALLAELKDQRVLTPTVWVDDTGTYFYRLVTFNNDTNANEYSTVLTDGTAYTPGANPRPSDASADDRDVIFRPALYDDGATTDQEGLVVLAVDYAAAVPITQIGVLDSAYAPVATPTNVRRVPAAGARVWVVSTAEFASVEPSGDDATPTTLTIPAAFAAIADEDLQAIIAINMNANIKAVRVGATVAGVSKALADVTHEETFVYAYGTQVIAVDQGITYGKPNDTLIITGRANIAAFKIVNTSQTQPSKISVNWAVRSAA